LHGNAEAREFRLATLGDVVEVPDEDQIAVAVLVERVEVRLERFRAAGAIALEHQVGRLG
jgi:hypothetical protein